MTNPIHKTLLAAVVALSALLGTHAAQAAAFTFTTPDAPLPSFSGDGLNGNLWSNSAIAPVDILAEARTYIGANAVDSTFISTVVDYPNGALNSTSTGVTINSALGVDAASLSNAAIGTNLVLNTILQMNGFLKVVSPGSLFLSLGSDDGSELLIQGTQVIDNDGIHAFSSPVVEIEFTTAGLYDIEILFFESQQSQWGLEFGFGAAGANPVPAELLYHTTGVDTAQVPEPGTLAMFGLGLAGFGFMRRKRAI